MMKPIDDEKRGLMLESIMELIKEMKSGNLDKLPKGKGISMMSISVSKPKKDMEMPEEMSEAPEMEEGIKEMSEEAPKMSKEAPEMEEGIKEMSEKAPKMSEEAPEMEEEDEYKLPEPAIPEDLMKLVMEMMKNKQIG